MKVLVIGGTRFIGAHVVRQVHNEGGEITVFHRGQNQNSILPDVEHILDPSAEYPITTFPDALLRQWDVVIHMVAMGEADTKAAVQTFAKHARRFVLISSGDVYRAYGRLTRIEPGPPEPAPLVEGSSLRTVLYPYRGMEAHIGSYATDYDKTLAEKAVQDARDVDWTILRLPKVYGPEDNADLSTVYNFAAVPDWRWTHGHVANVGHAIATAALHPQARNDVFNVGEEFTPTMGERLLSLPERDGEPMNPPPFDFDQSFAVDTSKIRKKLGYKDIVDEETAMRYLLTQDAQ